MPEKEPRAKKLRKIAEGLLADPDADTVTRMRTVASALELEKVADFLDSSEEFVDVMRRLLKRSDDRYTLAEAAARGGMTPEQFSQLNLACGFADPGADARVFTEEDIRVLQLFQASTVFFGEDVAMQNVRVMGSAMGRVADAFVSSFATTVGRKSSEGEFDLEDVDRANEVAISLLPGAMQAMDVLLRRHMELKSRPDIALGENFSGVDAVDRGVGFCDLVGYTALAEQISTSDLAGVLREFETTAADLITSRGGTVVKLIGDEVMFVAPDAVGVCEIALALVGAFSHHERLPVVRVGISAGRVITREGDYFGPEVNLAARIVKLAAPGGILAPASFTELADGYNYEDAGAPDLKGILRPVPLVSVRR